MPQYDDPVAGSLDPRTVLHRVRLLRGVTWEWKGRRFARGRRPRSIGLLAQDVQQAFPEAVSTDTRGRLRVDYDGLVGVLVEAVKELADRVEELERRLPDR